MTLALPELLTKIFNFLAEDNALYPTLFVSRLWFTCFGSILWCRIELIGDGDAFGEEYKIQLKKFLKIVRKNSRLTYGSSVRYLKISDYHKLSNKVLGKFIEIFPNIIHLDFKRSYGYNDTVLFKISQAYPNLIHLNVFNNGKLTDYSIIKLARISGGKSCISDKSIHKITQFNSNIQFLNFNNCKKFTDITIHALVGSYLDLRELDLSDLMKRYVLLCNLNLKFCNVTDTAVEAVSQSCCNIEYLNLYGSESITDKSISKLAKMCSKVRNLELGFCELITDIAIKDIAHNLSDLKYLGLKYCINISKEALDILNSDLDISGYYTITSAL
ncbi:11967_t:CDS:2 [Diversispora eburnea]|uniref:11967_t:CDS:1 n=1 Tax=Diversispora eburnea TaxID=1213867 RepID=A0A9N9GC38_9GLOM|nr:11967_t:CDS:2 [Diversispora eburnea]